MYRGHDITREAVDFKGGESQQSGYLAAGDMQSKTQMGVLGAMAIVSLTAAVAAYVEGLIGAWTAALGGVLGFCLIATLHSFMRYLKHCHELAPRVGKVEMSVEQLRGHMGQLSDLSEKFKQLDSLADQVEALELRLREGAKDASYPGNRANDAGILQEVAGLEKEIKGMRAEFEEATNDQHYRFNSELQILQTLIKQVADQVANRDNTSHLSTQLPNELPIERPAEQPVEAMARPVNERDDQALGALDTAIDVHVEPYEPVLSASSPLLETENEIPISPEYLEPEDGEEFDAPSRFNEDGQNDFSLQELEDTLSQYDVRYTEADMVEVVKDSIENNRVELFLQPIVGLPERNVRYYEALSRLRGASGALISPDQFIEAAERSEMMPVIDNITLFRTVQVIRRLTERDSSRGVFCNISPYSLVDPEFFPEFIEFMGENRQLAKHLFFEFSQSMIRSAEPRIADGLEALAEFGFQFSLDKVTNLNIDFNALGDQAFRFVKLDVRVFLHGMADAGARIHAADMAGYLERFGLQLIIEKIEDERSAASLIDYDIALGQGYLFSEPRPVRPEIFDGAAMTAAA